MSIWDREPRIALKTWHFSTSLHSLRLCSSLERQRDETTPISILHACDYPCHCLLWRTPRTTFIFSATWYFIGSRAQAVNNFWSRHMVSPWKHRCQRWTWLCGQEKCLRLVRGGTGRIKRHSNKGKMELTSVCWISCEFLESSKNLLAVAFSSDLVKTRENGVRDTL